jgi:hypothetical protein
MQIRIGNLIRSGSLASQISGGEALRGLLDDSEDVLPVFSIDKLARNAMIRAALGCLDRVHDISLLTDDLNVSAARGEILRPDFVGISHEDQSIWIFELKNDSQTARQALTEMLGYEHEVKNHLPFLADWDTNFVLISSEWSVLLDHGLGAACAWSGKKILGLEASMEQGQVSLRVRIPDSWSITGVARFPPESLPTFQISLAGLGEGTADESDPRLFLAMTALAREGDRAGSHGFALLWRDRAFGDTGQHHITVCGVSPAAFFHRAVEIGTLRTDQGHLVTALGDAIEESIDQTPGSLFALYDRIKPLLSEVGDPTVEGLMDWTDAQDSYLHRAEPVLLEFWGALGDFARQYVFHPAIRKHRSDLLGGGMRDWRDPVVGLAIIGELFARTTFGDGQVRLRDAYELGRDLGIDATIRQTLDQGGPPGLHAWLEPRRAWHSLRIRALLEEVRLIASAATNVSVGETLLRYGLGAAKFSADDFQAFVDWTRDEFLQGAEPHVAAFELGLNGSAAFDRHLAEADPAGAAEGLADLAAEIASLKAEALRGVAELDAEGGLMDEQRDLAAELEAKSVADEDMVLSAFDLLDTLVFPVFHDLAPVAKAEIDWDFLKQGVREARSRGAVAAVALGADGLLGTRILTEPWHLAMGDVANPETDVLAVLSLSGMEIVRKTTWAGLKVSPDLQNLPRPDEVLD